MYYNLKSECTIENNKTDFTNLKMLSKNTTSAVIEEKTWQKDEDKQNKQKRKLYRIKQKIILKKT